MSVETTEVLLRGKYREILKLVCLQNCSVLQPEQNLTVLQVVLWNWVPDSFCLVDFGFAVQLPTLLFKKIISCKIAQFPN